MIVLAFDLAWVGFTGWVLWDADKNIPHAYGEFKARSSRKGVERDARIIGDIVHHVGEIIKWVELKYGLPDRIAYEVTDWFRDLSRSSEFNVRYKMERQAQRTLGKAEAAFLVGVQNAGYHIHKVHAMGVQETRKQFGARSKQGAAKLLAAELDGFSFVEKDSSLYHDVKQQGVSHHISDAMVLAHVLSTEINLQERIENDD